MRDSYNAAVLLLISGRSVGVLFRRDPGRPGTAVKERVPGVVTGVVGLRSFFPAGGNGAFYGRIGLFDIIGQICIHIVRTCGLWIEPENIVEFSEHVVYDPLLILHRKHPDTEIFGLVFFSKFLAGKPQKRKGDFVPVDFVIIPCDCHSFFVKESGIGHVNRDFESVFMGKPLLGLEDIERFCQKLLITDILFFTVSGNGSRIFRYHLGTVDYIQNKFTHFTILLL